MRKKIPALIFVLLLLVRVSLAQKLEPPRLDPTPSTESQKQLINEGVTLHDRGEYDAAISRYEQVLRENPNNVHALYEMSFSYFLRKDCKKSLETALKAARYKSDLLGSIYGQIGNCQDDLGQPNEAIETYKAGIKLLPANFLLHYNLGLTYARTGQVADALASMKRSASLNPNHTSSQSVLAYLFDKGGYKTPALLAACRFLILEPKSNRSDMAVSLVQKIMQAGVTPAKDGNNMRILVDASPQKKDEGDFSSLEMMMGIITAGNYLEKNKDKSETQLLVGNFNSLFAMLSESSAKADRSKFTWAYYVPYFQEMKKQGHMETFVYYINQKGNKIAASEWLQQNQSKVADFLNWSKGYQWPKTDF